MFLAALLAAATIVATIGTAQAETSSPPSPTTRILAIGTFPPGTDLELARRILPREVRATARLYLEGRIDQWYSLQDRTGVVFILNVTDLKAAKEMLGSLPLGQAHLMTFELMPIGPLNPLRKLLVEPGGQPAE
jgi:hypothetical protein